MIVSLLIVTMYIILEKAMPNPHYYLLGKGGYYLLGSVVCLFVCLWTTLLKSYEWIGMKFYGKVLGSTMKN